MNSCDEAFTVFLESEHIKGKSEQTIAGIRNKIMRLLRFLDEQNIDPGQVGYREACGYREYLAEYRRIAGNGLSKQTITTYLNAAASFYTFLEKEGYVFSNPFKQVVRPRHEKKLPRHILKEKQMNEFLEALGWFDEANGLREQIYQYKVHVIAELQYATGLRISEIAFLKEEDIDFEKGIVTVRRGKGGASRKAYLNNYACQVLELYVKQMRELVLDRRHCAYREYLFATGWRSFPGFVNARLNSIARSIGLAGFTSHLFRHALGYHLLKSGCSIRHIQQLLGHKNLKSTEVYTKVDKEELKEILDEYHPRQWKRHAYQTRSA